MRTKRSCTTSLASGTSAMVWQIMSHQLRRLPTREPCGDAADAPRKRAPGKVGVRCAGYIGDVEWGGGWMGPMLRALGRGGMPIGMAVAHMGGGWASAVRRGARLAEKVGGA